MRRLAFAALLLLAAQLPAGAQERIINFVSDVTVLTNGDLEVAETITIQAEGNQFRRGIFRDFPTSYRRRDGTYVVVGFDVISVTRNGQQENFTTEGYANGVRTRIGNANINLSRGQHTYVIRYRTTRQIGYFETFDELYWNATGNGWAFTIDGAEARVTLPDGAQIMQRASYTGPQGATGSNARVVEQTDNRIVWRTTRSLARYEGLTVAVGWQKGVIAPPSTAQRVSWFLRDNLPILAALIGIIGVGFYYLSTWTRVGRDPPAGTIIPLFAPPNDMSPAAVRYLDQLSFDMRAFTAAIVELGVKGHLKLTENSLSTRVDALSGGKPLAPPEAALCEKLFSSGDSLELDQKNHVLIGSAKDELDNKLSETYAGKLFANNFGWSSLGLLLAAIAVASCMYAIGSTKGSTEAATGIAGALVPSFGIVFATFFFIAGMMSHKSFNLWLIAGAALWLICVLGGLCFIYWSSGPNLNLMIPALACYLLTTLAFFGFYWFKAPSREGQKIRDQIAGFREYLGVAEEDRLNFMNPPEKTPALFEKFLPYAIALDVENEWGKKFAGILAAAAAAGAAYAWYSGNRDWSRDPAGFSNHVGSTIAATIASSATAPGSSSGSSGGGSSGGGGGGGGGGGW